MKQTSIIQRLCLFLFALLLTPAWTYGEEIKISTKEDWKHFCDLVNNGNTNLNAKLMTNINLGTDVTMVGNSEYPYAGTFDGAGHSITMNWNTAQKEIALFRNINGATIKNLHTKGSITTSNNIGKISGMVWSAAGHVKLTNCSSMVNLTATGSQANSAGMMGTAVGNSQIEITDCVVGGKFRGTTNLWSGFISFDSETENYSITNCLYIGDTLYGSSGFTFAPTRYHTGKLNNCYYLNAIGEKQGTKVTAEQLKSGYVAHKLQAGRSETVWGQELDKDNNPQLTADTKKRVHRVEFRYNDKVWATHYVNNGKTVTPPTVQDIVGSSYDPHHYYTFAFSENITSSTPINADKTVAITLTEKDYFEIGSPNDWQKFCEVVNGGQNAIDAKLTEDINLGAELSMVGTETNMYSGTFDGQGHSITVNWNTAQKEIALFRNINEVTIKNLHTKGSITTSNNIGKISGMVWSAAGHVKLTNCSSMVNLTATGIQANSAGMIGYTEHSSYSELTDCLVGGKFSGSIKYWYGFVRYQGDRCVLKNCLYIGENPEGTTGDTFVMDGNGDIDNCYYLNPCGKAQGEKVTAEQLKRGYVAHKLQNGRAENVWGQTLGKDDKPMLTTDAKKKVYKVEFKHNNNVAATHYVNNGKTVTPPTVQDIVGSSYDPHHYYTFAFSENITSSTPINADKTVAITLTEKDYFEIGSPNDWQKFCEVVNAGQNTVDAKLTEDIDLGADISMVGTNSIKYGGTFDGQNHSITVNWSTNQPEIALFRNINEATIKNLHTKGSITTSSYWGGLSGMVWQANGHVTLTACSSMVNLTATGSQANSAGMIGYTVNSSYSELTDCLVGGKFSGNTSSLYGFIRYIAGLCVLKNCLYIGENPEGTTGDTFVMDGKGVIDNCYYLYPCGTAQGEQVTEEQLRNGYVAHKLQNGRSETVWGQTLGTDYDPLLTADTKKRVHRVEFRYNDKVWATHYVNNGKTVTPPTVQDIVGSSYDPQHYYTFAFSENITSSTPINADKTVAITLTEKDYFEIGSPNDWQKFCDLVNGGQNDIDAKLTQDINLGTELSMVGTETNMYSGTFDGQGHSITVGWNTNQPAIALFRYINEATIKNLHTKGSITTSSYWGLLSGMVWQANGHVTLTACSSMVNLTATGSQANSAGMIGYTEHSSYSKLTDCLVGGKFSGRIEYWYGFVRYQGGWCVLKNCLYIGENPEGTTGYTFVMDGKGNLENCYYLNPCGKAQGKKVTAEQLKNGYVLGKLGSAWAQKLGEMPELYSENKTSEDNYLYYDTASDKWTCDKVQMTDGKAMPVSLDFHANTVNAERSLTAKKIYTITLPFAWREAGKAYELSSVSGKVAHFKEVTVADGATYEAYKPYLFVPESDVTNISASDLTIKAEPAAPMSIEQNGVKFTACYAGMSNADAAAAGAYILQDDKQFHKVTTENTDAVIPPYRAFLTLPASSPAKMLSIAFGDEVVTGISAIETTDLDGTVRYYDLSGRYIGTSLKGQPRGVYVGNGKKVLKK